MKQTNNSDTPLNAEQILKTLADCTVDYVLVGGLAEQTHGHIHTSAEVGVLPSPKPANLARLADALNALNAEILNPGHEDEAINAKMLPRATLWQLMTPHGAVDILHEAPGAPAYAQLRKHALEIQLGEIDIAVAGLDDLISMKRASGRPVDLDDLAALTQPEREHK